MGGIIKSCKEKLCIMVTEYFIQPNDYEKWFSENEIQCNTGTILSKYMGKPELTEKAMDLTDCLKDFLTTVKGVVINNNSIYKNHYVVKPIISYLLHLKREIYFQIVSLLDESKPATIGTFCGSNFIDFNKLVEQNILTKEEVTLIKYPISCQFSNIVDDLDTRDVYIATDYADDTPDIYFSIRENKHFDIDSTPHFIIDAPFEVEPGLINLKSWAVYELYRLFKMTEICAKIVTENNEVSTSLLANRIDISEIIYVFDSLNEIGVEFDISKTEADYKIKQFLHRQGVETAYEYTDTDIQNELISLMQQLVEFVKKEKGEIPDPQIASIAQHRLEEMFGIVYEKLVEYYFQGLV